ncbi:MAG: response regulator [Bradymonadia bacterium]
MSEKPQKQPPVKPPIHIVLVEDDDNDVRIIRRAIRRGHLNNTITVVRDGQEALDYLHRRPPFDDTEAWPWPDLLLLDIHLPRINGIDVLQMIKRDPELNTLPVLMLTTSARREDVAMSYMRGANGFICKPIEFARFIEVINDLNEYWTAVSRGPSDRRSG